MKRTLDSPELPPRKCCRSLDTLPHDSSLSVDDSKCANYTYRPLRRPEKEIRIVVLEPALDENAALKFYFEHADIVEVEGQYEAISYVWGEPIMIHPLYHTTDNTQVFVTENLDRALRNLRRTSERRKLWADAICIDQSNPREKEKQIPMMVDIFRNAEGVLAWLGQGVLEISTGMAILKRMSRCRKSDLMERSNREVALSHTDNQTSDIHCVMAVFNLPYFRRLWIVQEVVFSVEVTLIYGNIEISWLRILAALTDSRWFPSGSKGFQEQNSLVSIKTMARLWQENCLPLNLSEDVTSNGLFELVTKFEFHDCTDARDRIFALHSMAKDNHIIPVDFNLSVLDTYRNFAVAYVELERIDAVLDEARRRRNSDSLTMWPSWIPDWRLKSSDAFTMSTHLMKNLPGVDFRRHRNDVGGPYHAAIRLEHLAIDHLQSPDIAHIRCTLKHVIRYENSLFKLMAEIAEFYKAIAPESKPAVSQLANFLSGIWDVGGDYERQVLRNYLVLLSHGQPEPDLDYVGKEMIRLITRIEAALVNQCFFFAKIYGLERICLGFSTSRIARDDCLVLGVPVSCHGDGAFGHSAYVLRPVQQDATHHAKEESDRGNEKYHFVDFACVNYMQANNQPWRNDVLLC